MMLKGIYNKMAHMNYYTYTEHQTDDEVEGEIILKKHTLPQLPYEIICDILYKFGGMENPIVKDMVKIKSKVEFAKKFAQDRYNDEKELESCSLSIFQTNLNDLPLRNIKRFDDDCINGLIYFNRLTKKTDNFVYNIYKNISGDLNKVYYYLGRYFNSYSRREEKDSVLIKEGQHTYIDSDIFEGWSMEVRKDNKDKLIPYSKGTLKEVQEYYGRHLINIKMTAKQLKEYLDNNGIEYKKSWNKTKLVKACYSF